MAVVNAPSPTFSMVVTCYKRERYVAAALRSASLAQEFARKRGVSSEVVLVADLPSLAGLPLELVDGAVVNERLPRVGDMILRGAEAARGTWLAFLDDDDLFAPEKLVRLAETIAEHPNAVYVHNRWRTFGTQHGIYRGWGTGVISPSGPLMIRSLIGLNASSIAVRKDVLAHPRSRRALHNVVAVTDASLLWLALGFPRRELVSLGDVLTFRRIHDSNTTLQYSVTRTPIAAQLRWMRDASPTREARAMIQYRIDAMYPPSPRALLAAVRGLDRKLAVSWLAARFGRNWGW